VEVRESDVLDYMYMTAGRHGRFLLLLLLQLLFFFTLLVCLFSGWDKIPDTVPRIVMLCYA
jgi:hypothetical protein